MLYLVIIATAALQAASARGYLEECLLNRTQWLDDDVAIDVLRTFYMDLRRVGGIRGEGEIAAPSDPVAERRFRDALDTLKVVNAFNIAVDGWYRLQKSPNLAVLAEVYNAFKDQTAPLEQVAAIIMSTRATIGRAYLSGDRGGRIGPSMFLFREPATPVDDETVNDILCEYGHKLHIMGLISDEPPAGSYTDADGDGPARASCLNYLLPCLFGRHEPVTDYDDVLAEFNETDPSFARELNKQVVQYVYRDVDKALDNVDKLCQQAERGPDDHRESYAKWLRVELYLVANDLRDLNTFAAMLRDLDKIRDMRQTRPGVSLGKILELRARVVFGLMKCLHNRLARPN